MQQFFPGGAGTGAAGDPENELDDMPPVLTGALRERLRRAAEDPAWGQACADAGRQWARTADERFRAATEIHPERRPLLRVGVKDNIHCRDFATGAGSPRFRAHPQRTAPVLDGVPAEYVTCKTRLTEVTLGLDAGCVNPVVAGGWPGASSTGSAVAVAANICDVAVGSDSLGSVRIPSIACGVVGLRMTYDPVLLDGVLPVSPSLDAVGWFARTVDDLRFALERFDVLEPSARGGRSARRLALVTEVLGDSACEPGILRAYEKLTETASARGFDVVRIALGDLWKVRSAAWALCAREAYESLTPHIAALAPLGEDVVNVLRLGERVAAEAAEELRRQQPALAQDLRARLDAEEIDALLLPVYPFTLPTPESIRSWPMLFPDVHDAATEGQAGYTPVASLLGWPALSVPTARQAGVQLVGRPNAEGTLLDIAEQLFS
jgi:Asp-tRNA(Asn)/Glu-tRNA(Gln) amidotransferase A subunit family amidase